MIDDNVPAADATVADAKQIAAEIMHALEAPMTLDGQVVMTITASAIPDQFKNRNARSGTPTTATLSAAVAAQR